MTEMTPLDQAQQKAEHFERLWENAAYDRKCGYSGLDLRDCKTSICDCFGFEWLAPTELVTNPGATMTNGSITKAQYDYLLNPLRGSRVASRSQGGKSLSYLKTWDVKAHLTRIFGFGNWDSETLESSHVFTRDYQKDGKEMVEVAYKATVQLTVRDQYGQTISRQSEGAVGSASGPIGTLGDHHDNALKTATSDALKRCAINWGTQFGLSLYDDGSRADVVRQTLIAPSGPIADDTPEQGVKDDGLTDEQRATLESSLGAQEVAQ